MTALPRLENFPFRRRQAEACPLRFLEEKLTDEHNQMPESNQLPNGELHFYTERNHRVSFFDYARGPAHGRINVRGLRWLLLVE